ncbi:hypothetical protein [Caballeronia novacaledonica]|uniref:Uncharacterized protein n=1 Tax=Caballeronia novacaledonica TaxID=1544861 RepID=A0AA37I901_9BURK|nr:hypothetical protein [Caballeronia novacaledonica]GJH24429.1 hypothetical protein CBA19CS42_07955 [Caballeronia novacaledonica]
MLTVLSVGGCIECLVEQRELALKRRYTMTLRRDEIVILVQLRNSHVPVSGGQTIRGRAAFDETRQYPFQVFQFALRELRWASLSKGWDGCCIGASFHVADSGWICRDLYLSNQCSGEAIQGYSICFEMKLQMSDDRRMSRQTFGDQLHFLRSFPLIAERGGDGCNFVASNRRKAAQNFQDIEIFAKTYRRYRCE